MYKFVNCSQLQPNYNNNSTVQSHYHWRKNHFLSFLDQTLGLKSRKKTEKEGKHRLFIVCLSFIYLLFKQSSCPCPYAMYHLKLISATSFPISNTIIFSSKFSLPPQGSFHLRFSGIRPLRGYPPPLLTENQSEKKKVFFLSGKGGYPPP